MPNCYSGIATSMAMSTFISEKSQELLIYEQALASRKPELWKQAINKEVQALRNNRIW